MRYLALVSDYDGTIAQDGKVDDLTIAALQRVSASGRKLVLVTGRQIEELLQIFPRVGLFDSVVGENGGVLYDPRTRKEDPQGEAPSPRFVEELRRRSLQSISVGKVIVATWQPYEKIVLDAIRDCGLELHVIFNKGAVMILPSGINKASGLRAALRLLGLSVHNAVGVGDAENDHAFLSICECSVAVANAVESIKNRADIVTRGGHGAGVIELVNELLANDLERVVPKSTS